MSIGYIRQSSASVPTPPVGEMNTFIDSADDKLKRKDSTGSVTPIEPVGSGVDSFNGRVGAVVPVTNDYSAAQVSNTPAGNIVATNVQTAINELDTEKAPQTHVGSGGVSEHALVTGAVAGFMSPSDFTKLGTVATGATANSSDAFLLARANHTGTQLSTTISDFNEAAQDAVGNALVDTSTIDFTYNDGAAIITADIVLGSIANTHISAIAAIDATKIANGTVSNAEFQTLDGVTSSIQTQLNGKEPTITTLPISKGGTNSSTALNNNRVIQSSGGAIIEAAAITAARALISDANGIPTHSATTATELGFLSGVTSNIQTQLNGKIGIIQEEGVSLPAEPILNFQSIYLTGTNDPGNTRTNVAFSIDTATQQAGTATDMLLDFLPIYDASAVTHNKISPRSLNLITVPSFNWVVYEDFNNVMTSYNGGLVDANTGAGSGATSIASVDTIHMGLLNVHTGTTATGKGSVWNSGSGIVFGNGAAIFESCFQINTLSSGTQTYTFRVGFGDSITAESTDGVFFRYTDSVNSGNWQGVARNNNSETVLNTSTTVVAGSFVRLRIEINSAANLATFFINGTSAGTVTTNIPQSTARETGLLYYIQKSVGTTDTTTSLDYIMAYKQITTQR